MSYASRQEVKIYLGITWEGAIDSYIDTYIAAVTRYIEEHCGDSRFGRRVFEAVSTEDEENEFSTRYFNGNGSQRLYIGDLRELSTITVDGVALTLNTDCILYPLNAAADGHPYTAIELIQPDTAFSNQNPRSGHSVPYVFEELQRNIAISAKWGFSELPPSDIKLATMKLVGAIIKENIGDSDLREVTQESLGEYSTSFAKIKDIAHALNIDGILEPYKRKANGKNKNIQVS